MNHIGANLQVAVEYQVDEYKQVVRDFISLDFATTGKAPNRLLPWNWPIVEAFLFSIFVPSVFLFKKRKVGSCMFTVSEAGLSGTSKSGTSNLHWNDIKEVKRFSSSYLIELKMGGAMPIPYRVFTPEQRQLFERLACGAGKVGP